MRGAFFNGNINQRLAKKNGRQPVGKSKNQLQGYLIVRK